MSDRIELPERSRTIDQLVAQYERLNDSPLAKQEVIGPSRDVSDPFGFTEAPVDQMEAAKEVTVRLVKFFMLASETWKLNAEGMLFAAELTALNILNSRDIPLTPAKQMAIRDAAFKYYQESLRVIPEPKSATRK